MGGYDAYQKAIKTQLTLNPEEWNFKNNKDYTAVLEHVSKSLGKQYLNSIIEKFKTFYESNFDTLKNICDLNDKYGKTNKHQYENFMTCSPSNLRYISHALLILEDMKKYKLDDVDIIEIGGGLWRIMLFYL